MADYPHVELRLRYPGHPCIAYIDGLNGRHELNRRWIADWYFRDRRERHADGQQAAVYHLPLIDAVYEVRETVDERRVVRYVATREDDPSVYHITRDAVESVTEGRLTLDQAVARSTSSMKPEDSRA